MADLDRTVVSDDGFLRLPVGTTAQRDAISSPSLGMTRWNSEEKIIEYYDGSNWLSVGGAAGGGTIASDLATLNSALNGYIYNDVSNIKADIETLGFTLVATPAYNGMAESQSGTTNISSLGEFLYPEWDSGATLENSDGFSTGALNGYPYMGVAGFSSNGFEGMAAMMYRDYSSASLRDFFAPNQNRNLYCYVLNANGSEVIDTSGNTSTIYSDGQSPNSNGYNSTSRFASDDGSWGFSIGTSRLDGNGGPYLNDNTSNAYGVENRNGGDGTSGFYWGAASNSSSTTHGFYFFIRRAA